MLDRIKLSGFKSIKEMDLQLSSINVLIGANGSGKSNFISVFRLLNQIVEERLQFYVRQTGGAETLLYFGRKTTDLIRIDLYFGPIGYKVELFPTNDDSLFLGDEQCSLYDLFDFNGSDFALLERESLGKGQKESLLENQALNDPEGFAGVVIGSLKSWKIYHFHDTSESAKVKQTNDLNDNALLRPDAANLAAFLFMLREKHKKHYEKIVKVIRLAAPFFDDFILRPTGKRKDKVLLEWREKGSDNYFNAHALSDGTLRFICLATLLLQPELPSTILIDEPELGLHPYAITLLADLLQSANTQAIISTQSVPLVNQFSPENIIVVDREDNQSIFKKLNIENVNLWLEDYSLGEVWEKNLIGGRPR